MSAKGKLAVKVWAVIYAAVAVFAILGKVLGAGVVPVDKAVGRLLDEPVKVEGMQFGVGAQMTRTLTQALERSGVEEVRARRRGILGFRHYSAALTLLNFAGLVILIYAFAWEKLIAALDSKIEAIRNELATADSRKKESLELLRTYEQLLKKTGAEREKMLGEAEADGKSLREEMVASAEKTAAVIEEAARKEILAREEHARSELGKEVSLKAIDLAKDVLRREVSEDDHEFLVQDFLKRLKEMSLA